MQMGMRKSENLISNRSATKINMEIDLVVWEEHATHKQAFTRPRYDKKKGKAERQTNRQNGKKKKKARKHESFSTEKKKKRARSVSHTTYEKSVWQEQYLYVHCGTLHVPVPLPVARLRGNYLRPQRRWHCPTG
jgi:hypothetical protein